MGQQGGPERIAALEARLAAAEARIAMLEARPVTWSSGQATGGYQCGVCFQWVPQGTFHVCGGRAS